MFRPQSEIVRPLRIIDGRELRRRVPYSRAHIARLEAQGRFPRRVKLGEGRVGWVDAHIDRWILERARASGIDLNAVGDHGLNNRVEK